MMFRSKRCQAPTLARPLLATALATTFAAVLSACAATAMQPTVTADVKPTRGNAVNGRVTFAGAGDGVSVNVKLHSLLPGEHGFHVHEKGDCSAPDAMSAGGHWNPDAKPHGPQSAPHHAGDMPSIKADAGGEVDTTFTLPGPLSAYIGKAVVVHADPDDYKTQPTGNSGGRVACGVIVGTMP